MFRRVEADRFSVHFSLIGVSSLGVIFLASTPAPAEATRPLVSTSKAIQNVRLSMPIAFDEVSEKGKMGLDIEEANVRNKALAQAKDYSDFRRHSSRSAEAKKWRTKCEKELESKKDEANPFCQYEDSKHGSSSSSSSRNKRSARQKVADELKAARFDDLSQYKYSDVVYGLARVADEKSLFTLAEKALAHKKCVPSTVATALGYKIEEHFPAEDKVELSKKLYQKASSCEQSEAAAIASFRLGLIHIWQKKCSDVPKLMEQVIREPAASIYHSRAKYWSYHCSSTKGDRDTKQAAKESLLKEHPLSFHHLAANGEDPNIVGQVLSDRAPDVSVRSLIRPDLNPLIRGIEALLRTKSTHLAAEIVDRRSDEFSSVEPEVRLYLAILMHREEKALPKFKILYSLFNDVPRMVSAPTMRLYFPLRYFDLVKEKVDSVDPLLILSLIRQESAFNERARSIAGARGLMQLMPGTARTVERRVSVSQLYEPNTNLRIGTKYFMQRLKQYDGDVELTLAAYNAGFTRVDDWLKRYPTDNKLLFIDFIPFRETRDYVSSILRNYYWYTKLYGADRTTASVEGTKATADDARIQAILSANAGAAATISMSQTEGTETIK